MSAAALIALAVVIKILLDLASRRGHKNASATEGEDRQAFDDLVRKRDPALDEIPLGNMGSEQYAAVAGSHSILDDISEDIAGSGYDSGFGDYSSSWSDDR